MTDPQVIYDDALRELADATTRAIQRMETAFADARIRYAEDVRDNKRVYALRISRTPNPNCVLCSGGIGEYCACDVPCGSDHCKLKESNGEAG